ncbi:MAG: hypothetical protein AAGD22_15840 [Verrucomicrobiota bacterium]
MRAHRPTPLLLLLLSLFASSLPLPLSADPHDDIGYRLLSSSLGSLTPDGSGIRVSLVEASTSTSNLIYAPVSGTGTINGSGNYAGKTLVLESGASTTSSHAANVANSFFGLDTNPASTFFSIAPGITNIHSYVAGDDNTTSGLFDLLLDGLSPFVEESRVQSHAYVSRTTMSGGTTENRVLRRLDRGIDRDGYLAVVGMDNGAASPVPYLLGTGYNSLSVGLSNGSHSHGPIPAGLDGQGRIKPEIVTVHSQTSWATGALASAAAIHYQTLLENFVVPAADASMLIRAVMLAGATKEEFPAWDRTQSRPLDNQFGLGELNVYHNHLILTSGPQNAGPVTPHGWNIASIGNTDTHAYTFVVPPAQFADRLSVFVTWNRRIRPNDNPFPLANIDLALKNANGGLLDQSVSTIYNFEHIFAKNLPAGTYTAEISSDRNESYALAWRTTSGAGPFTQTSVTSSNHTTLSFSNLDPLATYHVQSSSTIGSWNTEPTSTFNPTGSTAQWTDPASIGTANKFYRLTWEIPSAPP